MATTTNIGLTKPAGTDKALVSVLNANSDIIDSAAGGLMDAIAIVANGNTHAAISAGQYVYVHNHGTLAEGLYTANSAIAANATLSTSNLTADASGGLNALNSKLSTDVFSLVDGADIPNNTNFNTLVTPGSYRIRTYSSAQSMINIPATAAGTLYVKRTMLETSNYKQQIYITIGNKVYLRSTDNNGTSWSAWDSLALNSKIATDWSSINSWCKSIESTATTYILKFGRMRTITFQGVSRSHTEDEIIMTLPQGEIPLATIFVTGNIGSVPVVIRLNSYDGNVALYTSNSAGTGRIYFSVSYVVNE